MNYRKFLLSAVLTTIALVMTVMLVQWMLQLFSDNTLTATATLSQRAIISGLIADTLRGIILSYAYPKTVNAGTSYGHAIGFGILASLLAASLWVIYQFGIRPVLGIDFLIEEMTITLLQGIFSGIVLGWVYKK